MKQGAVLFRVLGLLRPHLPLVITILVLMVSGVGLSLMPPYLTKILVDEVLTTRRHTEWLILVVAALAAAELGRAGLNMTVGRLSELVGTRITFDVRTRVFAKLQELSVDYYDRNPIGTLMTRVSSNVEAFHGFVTQAGRVFS